MNAEIRDWFEDPDVAADDEVLHVDVGGYEGPLDLLLDLARRQKVDLANVSVLALAEQYLRFIETVRARRLELAADYLVMAAWLAYLKSRLMVPDTPGDDEPSGEEMAAQLQFRLKRLEAMRQAAERLVNRPRLGQHVFARGDPEPVRIEKRHAWETGLYDLLRAYAAQRERGLPSDYVPGQRRVWALADARDILKRLVGEGMAWVALDTYLAEYLVQPEDRATVIASSFSASLELAREGELELRQALAFGPLMLRRRRTD